MPVFRKYERPRLYQSNIILTQLVMLVLNSLIVAFERCYSIFHTTPLEEYVFLKSTKN